MQEGSETSADRSWPDIDKAPGGEVVHLRRIRIKQKNGESTVLTDIRVYVGIEMTFEVLTDGYTLLPHVDLVNEEGICAFVSLDIDPSWRKRPAQKSVYIATAWIPGNLLAEGGFLASQAWLQLNRCI
jgi:lipopolysaccharide transport system ATP-binding protein